MSSSVSAPVARRGKLVCYKEDIAVDLCKPPDSMFKISWSPCVLLRGKTAHQEWFDHRKLLPKQRYSFLCLLHSCRYCWWCWCTGDCFSDWDNNHVQEETEPGASITAS